MSGASFVDIAQQIVDATRVVSNAQDARPGVPVNVSVIPGFSPALGTILSGVTSTLAGGTLGTLTGPITGSLLVDKVTLTVTFSVTKGDGSAIDAGSVSPDPTTLPANILDV